MLEGEEAAGGGGRGEGRGGKEATKTESGEAAKEDGENTRKCP